MATVNVYLNFDGQCEEAFNFYKNVFGGEFMGGVSRFRDMPPHEGAPPIPDEISRQVMHVALPILGGSILMGSDAPVELGIPRLVVGNNVNINLSPDTREEADRLFAALSADGDVVMEMQDMFWGAYYGICTDKYGIQWMVNYQEEDCE